MSYWVIPELFGPLPRGSDLGQVPRFANLELDRLESVMYLRPLYLAAFDFRRAVTAGGQPTGGEWWWGLIDDAHISTNAAAARAACARPADG